MACGAGFLACALAEQAQWVCGIDLSRCILPEAHTRAQTLGRHDTDFCQADAEALPLSSDACDLVACKLAFHHLPHPQSALAEMVRVATHEARMVLIDRVRSEDLERRAYQNRPEKLRTPGKTYVYSESQPVAAPAGVRSGLPEGAVSRCMSRSLKAYGLSALRGFMRVCAQEESLPCQPHLLAPPSSTGGSSSPRPFSSPW